MRVLIPCAGEGRRWRNFGGVPKHLFELDGAALLDGLLARIWAECPDALVGVVGRDERYNRFGALLLPPAAPLDCGIDKVLCTRDYWAPDHRTYIMWGDLYLTPAAAARIFMPGQRGLLWYGRCGASEHTGKRWGEIFALAFDPDDHRALEQACLDAAELYRAGGVHTARARTVYQLLHGQDPRAWAQPSPAWVEIDDRTEDFDSPDDLTRWLAARPLGYPA